MKWTIVGILLLGFMFPVVASALTDKEKVGGGPITFNPKGVSPVVFSHEMHVSEKGLKCTGCHYQIFQMAQNSYKMDMSKITKGGFCGKCHNGTKAFDVADKNNCHRCHK
jgi:c(7)-type cytochrome triheme protein